MGSIFFDGTTDYFTLSGSAIENEPLTMWAWVKVPVVTGSAQIWDCSNSGANEFFSLELNGGKAQCSARRSNGATGSAIVTNAALINEWTFVAGVFTSDTSRTAYQYSNGGWQSASDTTSIVQISSASPTTRLGAKVTGFYSDFKGQMFRPGIASRALSFEDLILMAFNPRWNTRSEYLIWCEDQGQMINYSSTGPKDGTKNGTPFQIIEDQPFVEPGFPTIRAPKVTMTRSPVFGTSGGWVRGFVLGKAPAAGAATNAPRLTLMGVG